ncbi:anaerobic glycerol-3-phosphate dehydrogenase subunit GlpB [Desulfosporosinus sp. FKA]|uniref:anaerobic glycerol-3-phosphate dehydrogenase subunit GlpB n=1 Tax=Desulfosporosinus sp. FKA TaxID=1969834 RepID=UPI000B49DD7C|nr:anaerobic glycerol-3-phosphate dehydrogenase subunit GlpB [Desulfosporosinus sp. FKA]
MWDGIVIGGGLSGLIAGIRASEKGKRMLVISEGVGSLTYSSGVMDFGDVERLKEEKNHPYALMGETVVRAGMEYFQRLFPDYQGAWQNSQQVLTPLGSPREADLVPTGLNAGVLQKAKEIVLIAPEGMKDFFPEVIKAKLERVYSKAKIEIYPVAVEAFDIWRNSGKLITGMDYAKYWRSDQGAVNLKNILGKLTEEMACSSSGATSGEKQGEKSAIIFPGLAACFSNVLKGVLEEVPLPIVEMTAFPPSASGQFLYEALKQKFKALGGELLVGTGVKKVEFQGKRCHTVIVKSKGKDVAFSAQSFILATGGIFGGGIQVGPKDAAESVMGLPLYVPAQWTNSEFLGEQPYAKMGVEVDPELRPLAAGNQEPLFDNVRIVGRLLAHWDPWLDHCGGGVSLASGWLAGEIL